MSIFSKEERRGLLWIIPLGVVALLLAALVERVDSFPKPVAEPVAQAGETEMNSDSIKVDAAGLKPFNPNTFEYEELRAAGVSVEVAVGIVRWRKYGKVYRIKEDLALVNGVNDSIYAALKPYIVIDDSVAARPKYEKREYRRSGDAAGGFDTTKYTKRRREVVELQPFMIDTASARYLYLLGFSRRQAEVIERYVKMLGGLRSEEELRDCYVISDSMAERILPYVIFRQRKELKPEERGLVDINTADTIMLQSVYGIGAKSAAHIVRYRELLGGYHSVEQLRELKCVTSENYARFFDKICCDSCKISKIDINFADPKSLIRHPYISLQALRRIVKHRQLKGGWSRIEEMVDDDILTEEEAKRLAPYLRFRLRATEKESSEELPSVSRTKRQKERKGKDNPQESKKMNKNNN